MDIVMDTLLFLELVSDHVHMFRSGLPRGRVTERVSQSSWLFVFSFPFFYV